MRRGRTRARLLLLAACGILVGACDESPGRGDGPTVGESVAVGARAPDFRLESLDRTRFYLHQQRGQVVALLFWRSWCTVCKAEMIALAGLRRDSGDHLVVATVLGDPENRDAARDALRGLDLSLPVLLDPGGRISARFGAGEVPTTVLIDREGHVGLRRQGWDPNVEQQIRTWVTRHQPLKQRAAP